jgi:hypothetical protein
MMAALAGLDRQVERDAPPRAQEDGRTSRGQAGPIGRDQHVGAEEVLVSPRELAQSRRAGLLAHFDEKLGIEAERPARFEHGAERSEVDRVLAFVVRDATTVPAALALGHEPGREPVVPSIVETADDVPVPVTEHRRPRRVLDALGEEKRPVALAEGPAAETERLESRRQLMLDVAPQLRHPVRVLAFGRQRDATREVRVQTSMVEIGRGSRESVCSGHDAYAPLPLRL